LFIPGAQGQKIERLAVDFDDYDRFRAGDSVIVGVEPGASASRGITACIADKREF